MNRIAASLVVAAALTAAAFQAGCNIGTPVAYAVFGAGKIEAEHSLAPVRTVVFVDDRKNILPRTALRVTIAEKISTTLMGQECIPSAVDPRQAVSITRQKEGSGKPLSIAAIGRELDCQQVIYVVIETFQLAGDGEFTTSGTQTGAGVTPTTKVSVKVIDVVNSERSYPLGSMSGGRELTAFIREVDPGEVRSFAQRRTIEDRLAAQLAIDVAELFFEHERINQGEHLGPRAK